MGQSLKPMVLNSAGKHVTDPLLQLEWSLGESSVIRPFIQTQVHLNTGFLQPLSQVVTGIENLNALLSSQQIQIAPNPAIDHILIQGQFDVPGQVQIRLLDFNMQTIQRLAPIVFSTQFSKSLNMSALASGSYFVQILFVDTMGKQKSGVYKIIKL